MVLYRYSTIMNVVTISEKTDRFQITAMVYLMGSDLLVLLFGGLEHIGAIGVAHPRPSLKDASKISSTGSVFTFLGHKEDGLAKSMSEDLARKLNRKTVAVAGIHWDQLTEDEIEVIGGLCKKIIESIVSAIPKSE